MKKIIFLFCFFMFVLYADAQNAQYKVTYWSRLKVGNATGRNGKNTLYFDNTSGLFVFSDYPKKEKWQQNGNDFDVTPGDVEGLPIYTNLKDKYLYFKSDQVIKGVFPILKENLPAISWKISGESKKIEKFNCIKAEGSFAGRVYDVWFSPEIPVGLGPHKLGGLPGLILEAKSRDGFVIFEFKSYESPSPEAVKLEKPSGGKEMTLNELKELSIKNLLEAEALSTEDAQTTLTPPPPNWDIEFDKYPFIADYKRARSATKK